MRHQMEELLQENISSIIKSNGGRKDYSRYVLNTARVRLKHLGTSNNRQMAHWKRDQVICTHPLREKRGNSRMPIVPWVGKKQKEEYGDRPSEN